MYYKLKNIYIYKFNSPIETLLSRVLLLIVVNFPSFYPPAASCVDGVHVPQRLRHQSSAKILHTPPAPPPDKKRQLQKTIYSSQCLRQRRYDPILLLLFFFFSLNSFIFRIGIIDTQLFIDRSISPHLYKSCPVNQFTQNADQELTDRASG